MYPAFGNTGIFKGYRDTGRVQFLHGSPDPEGISVMFRRKGSGGERKDKSRYNSGLLQALIDKRNQII
jgi:hypothetical protein